MPTLTFDYRPGPFFALFLLSISLLFTATFVWMALENDTSLDIFGLSLSPNASRFAWWGFAIFFGLGIPFGLMTLRQSVLKPRQVILTDQAITAPRGAIYAATKSIPFRDVTGFRVWTVQRNTFLEIRSGGQTLSIPKSCIRPAAQFDALAAAVEKRITASRINR